MTSQGAGDPLAAISRIDAERACLLYGSVRIQACGPDNEELAEMGNGDKAVFKYVDFSKGVKSISIRVAPGENGGRIVVAIDQPWHKRLANITIRGAKGNKEWQTLTFDVQPVTGVHALWLQFFGRGSQMFSIDWLTFN